MTSKERHEARYQRRKAKREQKAYEANKITFDEVFSFSNIYKAGKLCCNGIRWKTSTINFENNLLLESLKIYNDLHNDIRKFKGFRSFITYAHGKVRNIDALPIQERTMQKCLCKNLLIDSYSRSFVYDNGASLKGKGMDFQLNRLKKHLHDHYRKYGTKGGIYQFDLKNYFGSLPHENIKSRAKEKILDDRIYKLFCDFIDDFQYIKNIDMSSNKIRGVGLGSEISQIVSLDYVNKIDHYVKDVRGIHGYGRYMDDGYIISNSLDELKDIKEKLYKIANELNISMNDKKNIITPFRHHSFVFLKMRVSLSDTGKVTMKLCRQSIKSMRRKIKIFRNWVDNNILNFEDVAQAYQSWRAHARRCNSYNSLSAMDEYFAKTFEKELAQRKKRFLCCLGAELTNDGWKYYRHKLIQKET